MMSFRPSSNVHAAQDAAPLVCVIDPDPAIRHALTAAITEAGTRCQAYETAEDFLADIPTTRPACIVAETDLPGITAADLLERLSMIGDDLPMIMMAGQAPLTLVSVALRSGVVDFLEKPFRTGILIHRISEALDVSRIEVARRRAVERLARLTAREHEVLDYLTDGKPVSEIARQLALSPKTIQAHRANIMDKTQTLSVVELTRLCLFARPERSTAFLEPRPPAGRPERRRVRQAETAAANLVK
ncbi:MAG: LuxR C-terminal-related transcriptional regulator [Planctomycetota bacterium]